MLPATRADLARFQRWYDRHYGASYALQPAYTTDGEYTAWFADAYSQYEVGASLFALEGAGVQASDMLVGVRADSGAMLLVVRQDEVIAAFPAQARGTWTGGDAGLTFIPKLEG